MTRRVACLLWASWMLCWTSAVADVAPPRFERDILPILRDRCLKCHGGAERRGGLSLRTPAAMRDGGDSGPALVPGNLEESSLIEQVESGAMPPGKEPKLTAAEVSLLKDWVRAGGPSDGAEDSAAASEDGPRHWAFRPPSRPQPPRVRSAGRVRNPIDAFLLERLEAAGLGFSEEAGRLTLIRRASFDLRGLPPTPDEIDAFVRDDAPDAYERLVDRLLDSPSYGERWGRHWLDLAGYADSEGILAADHVRSSAWRYRDWVIRALNADMPYDRFLREQLAGDEIAGYWRAYKEGETLPPQVVEAMVATGYLRCAGDTSRPDFKSIPDAPGYYYQTLDDTLSIVASSTMALTLQCAKCHTHKYDPITQADYYRVQAIFMSGYRPDEWVPQVERRRFEATESQLARSAAVNAEIDRAVARRLEAIETITKGFAERRYRARLAALPVPIRDDVRASVETPADRRDAIQRYLASRFEAELRPDPQVVEAALPRESPRDRDLIAGLRAAIDADERRRIHFPEIRAFYDLPGVPKTPILRRGDYLKPGPAVTPGALPALATPEPFRWVQPDPSEPTSGRRRAFAEWLTQPGHPLTARVLVNRAWLHHFGEGIVSTPENFGIKGSPPSHPELLDWLANEFIDRGWSLKSLHRLIMTSSAYRQSSADDPGRGDRAREVDPDDRLLWRQRLRRLDAESFRDAVLHVSGSLNPAMGGEPVPMVVSSEGEVNTAEGAAGWRRSVYLQVRRSQPLTLLQVFDQPVMEVNCTRRPTSTVSSQALTLLNSGFMIRQAERLAGRAWRESPDDPACHALRLAFGRPATDAECALLRGHVAPRPGGEAAGVPAGLVDACQVLLSSNEFAYID